MKIFFIVGEDSGDALAAPLIKALKDQYGDEVECLGVGGPLMSEAGFDELLPMDQISIMGIWEVLPKIPRLLKLKKSIVSEIEEIQPDAVITVDFPDFNFIVAKALKKNAVFKGKIIHYVAPSVWAWRSGRAAKIAGFMDGMMCLFPMEVEYFTKHKLPAIHVGHDLVNSNALEASGSEFREENSIPPDAKVLGLFFGSRENEFKNLSSILLESAMHINDSEDEKIYVIAPTLPKLEYHVQKILQGYELPVCVVANPNLKWEALKACDVAIAVSGTVALELAYAGVPHVIAYKINPITAIILRFMVKIKHAHLANILLDKEVVPECLQGKCNVSNIAELAYNILHDEELSNAQKEAFKGLDKILQNEEGIPPSDKAAKFIIDLVKK